MTAVITNNGTYWEVWEEADPNQFDGGGSAVVTTGIRATTADLDYCRVNFIAKNITGTPVVPDPVVTVVNGYIVVSAQNTAAPGNKCAFVLEVQLLHSIIR